MKVASRSWPLLWLAMASSASADSFLQQQCRAAFPEAMSFLQASLVEHGYTVSRVQHVDKGLHAAGYASDRYRVVFFGRQQDMRLVRERYPALIPYLPLNITIYETGGNTAISALDPAALQRFYPDPALHKLLQRWQRDMVQVGQAFAHCDR